MLDIDEIQELYNDRRTNDWGAKSLYETENATKMFSNFQLFYYLNGRLPLTNSLLTVPDGEAPDGTDKINLKNLYEMFRDTNSHGLVSLQFLGALGRFFGLDTFVPKNAITELYENLSYETLSDARNLEFDVISDLLSGLSFMIKKTTLSNRDRQGKEDKKVMKKIIIKTVVLSSCHISLKKDL